MRFAEILRSILLFTVTIVALVFLIPILAQLFLALLLVIGIVALLAWIGILPGITIKGGYYRGNRNRRDWQYRQRNQRQEEDSGPAGWHEGEQKGETVILPDTALRKEEPKDD